eukprot:599227-Hanusia_phi.AAC.1
MYDYLVFLPQQACDFGSFISTALNRSTSNPFATPISPQDFPTKIVELLDKNHDGVLTVDETVCLQHDVFDQIAGYGSTSITPEKLLAFLTQPSEGPWPYPEFYLVWKLLRNYTNATAEVVIPAIEPFDNNLNLRDVLAKQYLSWTTQVLTMYNSSIVDQSFLD